MKSKWIMPAVILGVVGFAYGTDKLTEQNDAKWMAMVIEQDDVKTLASLFKIGVIPTDVIPVFNGATQMEIFEYCCWNNSPNCLEFLLANGADRHRPFGEGRLPIEAALSVGNKTCLKLLAYSPQEETDRDVYERLILRMVQDMPKDRMVYNTIRLNGKPVRQEFASVLSALQSAHNSRLLERDNQSLIKRHTWDCQMKHGDLFDKDRIDCKIDYLEGGEVLGGVTIVFRKQYGYWLTESQTPWER